MGNSKTSRYADGKMIHDLAGVTAGWLRGLAEQSRFELLAPAASGLARAARRFGARRFAQVRLALARAPVPRPVSVRRGAGEVQRVLLDPDVAPRLRKIARRHRQDEGDVASVWASTLMRASPPRLSSEEAASS